MTPTLSENILIKIRVPVISNTQFKKLDKCGLHPLTQVTILYNVTSTSVIKQNRWRGDEIYMRRLLFHLPTVCVRKKTGHGLTGLIDSIRYDAISSNCIHIAIHGVFIYTGCSKIVFLYCCLLFVITKN